MGFSLTGLLIALAVLAPNVLFLAFPPLKGKLPTTGPGLVFTVLERAGQIGCFAILPLSAANFDGQTLNVWFFAMVGCIVVYYGLWVRYLARGRDVVSLFGPLGFVPIPLAIVPVLAFVFAAVWGDSIWLLVGAIVLAIGHWPTSWHSYRAVTTG